MCKEPDMYRFLQVIGLLLIVLGVLIFFAPFLLERMPSLEKVPWIILYVYRDNHFVFVTSPILIMISIMIYLINIITKEGP